MHSSWSSAQVRAAEEPLLAAGVPLMERASFALAGEVRRELLRRRGTVRGAAVTVLAGPGSNGGDALHAGALLVRAGVQVVAVATADRVHEGGLTALHRAGGRALRLGPDAGGLGGVGLPEAAELASRADVLLDGLLGIGATGAGVRGAAGELVAVLAERWPPGTPEDGRPCVVAVDVPSGVGVDDGTRAGPVLAADLTVTFGGLKPALLVPPAARAAGRVEVVDLGLDLAGRAAVVRLEDEDVAALWPVPGPEAHKYTRGVLGVVAGTRRYPGAAVLASTAAVLAGLGMVRYVGDVGPEVVAARPEVVVGEGRVQAWVLGPGVDPDDAGQRRRVDAALVGVR
ncbi:NAD(P)H-hydrate epimerase, partial [Cellulomonas massiliensis]|uniref:NAD(P)H-hydrate epimerase n=1 Tax=Cellulomonas massiliensis TaxID=1465811 RepID=UPI00035D0FE5